jgi:hypothetical protein
MFSPSLPAVLRPLAVSSPITRRSAFAVWRLIVIGVLLVFQSSFSPACGQSTSAAISGVVTDPKGSPIVNAEITLKSVNESLVRKVKTDSDGLFAFPNIQQGAYELEINADGFKAHTQRNIVIRQYEQVRLPVSLEVGQVGERVDVSAAVSQLNVETPEVKGTIARTEIEQLPLQVAGAQRSAAQFVTLLPGVTPGGGTTDAGNARFNGGQRNSDEAILDGVTMQEGLLNQSGMIAIQSDFPIAPEAVNEISVLTSNYDVQYGSSAGAVIIASTKNGTNDFHGGAYVYHRNTAFNAAPWGQQRPRIQQTDFGFYTGGPVKWRPLWNNKVKTYFFGHMERFRSLGATTKPVLTLPTAKMRVGDFSEWADPIYDPATLRANPSYNPNVAVGPTNLPFLRDQFMGCNGNQPNVICQSDPRLSNALAQSWFKLLPMPNRPGVVANYEAPGGLASGLNANTNQYDARLDAYFGEKDHLSGTYHYRGTLPFTQSVLPPALDVNNTRIPNYSHIVRVNWDHVFSPALVNNFNIGYLDLPTNVFNSSDCCVSDVPQIKGVYSNEHVPQMRFSDQYSGYGGNSDFFTTRPTWAINDTITWIKGRHQLKFGGEWRSVKYPTSTEANGSGTFNFDRGATSVRGINSGNPMASFLLGAVSNATVTYYSLPEWNPTGYSVGLFVGDQWKVNQRLSLTMGVRWDLFSPSMEEEDRTSFFDPFGPNPGAGGRPGRMVFAGDKYGDASYGKRYPEELFKKAFAPRVGIAYTVSDKTVVRAGYGVFFMQNFYPGWNGGVATDGFNFGASFNSQLGGLAPAFQLQDGIPQTFAKPPFTTSTYLNGLNAPNYRPLDANELPYAQQWNLTIEQRLGESTYVSAAYVGNKGTRLLSNIAGINAVNPQYLSLGERLNDQFQPGQTSLNGVPLPYAGWVEQMRGCAPSVAQALRPYPQYCNSIFGQNENVGNSTYHSFQTKVERRLSHGFFFLGSYTWSKSLTSADSAQATTNPYLFSPYEQSRAKSYSDTDVPHTFALSLNWDLPFGKGKKLGSGVPTALNYLIGGWQLSGISRWYSGVPIGFRSTFCSVPSAFAISCVPGAIPGKKVLAQENGDFDPSKGPRYNRDAFENPREAFANPTYYGQGTRYTNTRTIPYRNQDLSLYKNFGFFADDRLRIQLRFEAFNVFNWHILSGFNADVASPTFGAWTGGTSAPRNLQLGAKITF